MRTNGDDLKDAFEALVEVGEGPYQANRMAVKEFDIFKNDEAGDAELEAMRDGLKSFIESLLEFSGIADSAARQALDAVHQNGNGS